MLYETLKQSYFFLGMLFFGMLAGLIFGLKNLIYLYFKNKTLNIMLDIFACILCAVLFIIAINFVNFGEIRLFLLISFAFGFYLVKISIDSLLAKFFKALYNITIKLFKKVKALKIFKGKLKNEKKQITTFG